MKHKFLVAAVFLLAFILRIDRVTQVPPSLYWDEASLGYNAYLIAQSGYDEHGEYLPISRFIAFGDYKPPGYIYTLVPFIELFGVNELSVRLPSILAGVVMVIVTYFLVKELFKSQVLGVLSSLLLAVSPWSIQLSRAAFEANLAASFNILAIYLFILSLRKKWIILPSLTFFIFSFYTFNANRIIAPLVIFALLLIYWRDSLKNYKWISLSLFVSVLLLLPSVDYLRSRESRLRFQEVSIFNNLEPLKQSNQRIEHDRGGVVSRIIHNRRLVYASEFLKHYFDNFSGRFLFTTGDINPRLSVQDMGQLYFVELPFLLLGLFWLIKRRDKKTVLLAVWMILAPIPAGLAKETPHALRIVSILPTYQIIIAYGIYRSFLWLREKFSINFFYLLFSIVSLLFTFNIYYYLHIYSVHYPVKWSGEWQYGYKEVVEYVATNQEKYDKIYVSPHLGRPYIFFALYQKLDFSEFSQMRTARRDWFGFWEVTSLGKIKFTLDDFNSASGKILLVTSPGDLPNGYNLLYSVKNPEGHNVFLIAEKR